MRALGGTVAGSDAAMNARSYADTWLSIAILVAVLAATGYVGGASPFPAPGDAIFIAAVIGAFAVYISRRPDTWAGSVTIALRIARVGRQRATAELLAFGILFWSVGGLLLLLWLVDLVLTHR